MFDSNDAKVIEAIDWAKDQLSDSLSKASSGERLEMVAEKALKRWRSDLPSRGNLPDPGSHLEDMKKCVKNRYPNL